MYVPTKPRPEQALRLDAEGSRVEFSIDYLKLDEVSSFSKYGERDVTYLHALKWCSRIEDAE